MSPRLCRSLRPGRAALGVRWLVLLVILFGTFISSLGGTNSHGIAYISASLHAAPPVSHTADAHAHGHAHEDVDSALAMGDHVAVADHPHHGADHSHDKAHALPEAWGSPAPLLPGWFGDVRPWMEMVASSRLERPPMG